MPPAPRSPTPLLLAAIEAAPFMAAASTVSWAAAPAPPGLAGPAGADATGQPPAKSKLGSKEVGPAAAIGSVVNGDVITNADVSSRGRLFALSTGMPITPEVLARLRPQITRQLIEERLHL